MQYKTKKTFMSNFLNQFILPATSTQPLVTTTVAQITHLVNSVESSNTKQTSETSVYYALTDLGYIRQHKRINGTVIKVFDVAPTTQEYTDKLSNHNTPLI